MSDSRNSTVVAVAAEATDAASKQTKLNQNSNLFSASVRRISKLIDRGDALTKSETDYLDLLGTLVEDYERRHAPEAYADLDAPVTTAEALTWAMDRHGLRQKDLCPYIGSEPLVSAIMSGRRSLSKAMIVRLHDGLGIPFERLMPAPATKPSYRKVAMF